MVQLDREVHKSRSVVGVLGIGGGWLFNIMEVEMFGESLLT